MLYVARAELIEESLFERAACQHAVKVAFMVSFLVGVLVLVEGVPVAFVDVLVVDVACAEARNGMSASESAVPRIIFFIVFL